MRFVRHPSENTTGGRVKDVVERMILSRGYRIGDKLPTYRYLAQDLGIGVRTIVRVMHELDAQGMVQVLHGKGVFIRRLPAGSGQLIEVGLVYPGSHRHLLQMSYLRQILGGMMQVCQHRHMDLQIISLHAAGGPVPPRDLASRVDGMILLEVINERYIAEFVREPIPLVLVDMQSQDASVPSICVDNAPAVEQVMDHLYGLGHRRIAYIDVHSTDELARGSEPVWHETADIRERREAYEASLRRLGLDYRRIYQLVEYKVPDLTTSLISDLSGKSDAPTAILCYDDTLGGDLCRLLPAAGVRIPRDLSVAAAVGSESGHVVAGHVVTTVIPDFDLMGSMAMEALRRQTARQSSSKPPLERVKCVLEVGTSTARPRRR